MRESAPYFDFPPSSRLKSAEITQTARKALCPRGEVDVTLGNTTERNVEKWTTFCVSHDQVSSFVYNVPPNAYPAHNPPTPPCK